MRTSGVRASLLRSIGPAGSSLLAMSLLLAGCGGGEMSPSELGAALQRVCQGEGVTEAAPYTEEPRLHAVIEIDLERPQIAERYGIPFLAMSVLASKVRG